MPSFKEGGSGRMIRSATDQSPAKLPERSHLRAPQCPDFITNTVRPRTCCARAQEEDTLETHRECVSPGTTENNKPGKMRGRGLTCPCDLDGMGCMGSRSAIGAAEERNADRKVWTDEYSCGLAIKDSGNLLPLLPSPGNWNLGSKYQSPGSALISEPGEQVSALPLVQIWKRWQIPVALWQRTDRHQVTCLCRRTEQKPCQGLLKGMAGACLRTRLEGIQSLVGSLSSFHAATVPTPTTKRHVAFIRPA
ncbi:hypothetical protein P7K49_007491 [Saguinus oedipus]|uniref:Uncharacterized protein n=1 Tax=Saguinus oedipus TaxID=9490 RepID=A0ABQ9VV41_SAGOE|nr:hypothetical protein P7K49_007491 [Saguinus oedipus]